MKPTEYLDVICKPLVLAFREDPAAISKAWAAVVALGQFADYLAAHRQISKREARALVEAIFPRFDLISDIGNASKHFELTDSRRTSRPGYSISHLKIGRGAAFSDGSFYSDGSSHSDSNDVVRADYQRACRPPVPLHCGVGSDPRLSFG
jgi:hypothetical protein